jgi:hypothetical protein
MRLLATNMQIEDISLLATCIPDPSLSRQLINLLNGVSVRYEQQKKEKIE